jgi:dTDP-4-dehydrorhamnose 3,5-epimerase
MDQMIDGVSATRLKIIGDDRGAVMRMLRGGGRSIRDAAEIYFSAINPGVVKAWKRHSRMTQRLTVPSGRVRFVLFDDRPGSSTSGKLIEIEIGRPDAYRLLVIPPGVWYGWKNLSTGESIVANCATLEHDPAESEHADLVAGMPDYQW